jgi:hypothetical protein
MRYRFAVQLGQHNRNLAMLGRLEIPHGGRTQLCRVATIGVHVDWSLIPVESFVSVHRASLKSRFQIQAAKFTLEKFIRAFDTAQPPNPDVPQGRTFGRNVELGAYSPALWCERRLKAHIFLVLVNRQTHRGWWAWQSLGRFQFGHLFR